VHHTGNVGQKRVGWVLANRNTQEKCSSANGWVGEEEVNNVRGRKKKIHVIEKK